MHKIWVRYNLGEPVVYAEELEGTPVTVVSAGDIVVPGHGGGMVDGYQAASSVVVVAGHLQQTLTLRFPAGIFGPKITVSATGEGGGDVLMAMGDGFPGMDTHAFMGTVRGKLYNPPLCHAAHSLGFKGFPYPGYWCAQSEYGDAVLVCGEVTTEAKVEFHKSQELKLDVRVEGEGSPKCAGVVAADPAQKYYGPGSEVKLSATSFGGFEFVGWEGEGEAWVKEGTGDAYSGSPDPLADIEDDTIFIKVGGSGDDTGLHTFTAVFMATETCGNTAKNRDSHRYYYCVSRAKGARCRIWCPRPIVALVRRLQARW